MRKDQPQPRSSTCPVRKKKRKEKKRKDVRPFISLVESSSPCSIVRFRLLPLPRSPYRPTSDGVAISRRYTSRRLRIDEAVQALRNPCTARQAGRRFLLATELRRLLAKRLILAAKHGVLHGPWRANASRDARQRAKRVGNRVWGRAIARYGAGGRAKRPKPLGELACVLAHRGFG